MWRSKRANMAGRLLRRRVRSWLSRAQLIETPRFDVDEIEDLRRAYYDTGAAAGGPWDRYRHAHMRLPSWFQAGLDPWSEEYAAQQHRLWAVITGQDPPYRPELHEQDVGWDDADPVKQPGFYRRRDALAVSSAADHVLATGMLLKHCGLKAGDWALEYGPGFAQAGLTLARLGIQVDAVDISPRFCDFVRRQAEHFEVPLHAFLGPFGMAPREGRRYQLIWFYESFHHCVDFARIVPLLPGLLAEGGRVILAGEPIVEVENEAVPYPWGVRLHSEVVAVMRQTRWFELGFSEAFLFEIFRRSGLAGVRIDCEPSLFGRLYVFERNSG